MRTRTFGTSGIPASEVGFGLWTVSTGWWGEHSDESGGRAPARGVRPRHHLLRHRRHLRRRPRRDAAGQGARRRARRHHDRDEVRLRHLLRRGSAQGQRRAPARLVARVHPLRPRAEPRRLGTDHIDIYQLHNPRMDAIQHDDLFDDARGGCAPKARSARTASRSARRSAGATRASTRFAARRSTSLQIIYNMLEQDPGRELIEAARGNGVGAHRARAALVGHARGHYTKDTVFAENDHRRHRPKEWLDKGCASRAARGSSPRRAHARAGRDQVAPRRAGGHDRPAEHLRPDQLREFAAAPDTADLSSAELERVADLYENDFYPEPAATGAEPAGPGAQRARSARAASSTGAAPCRSSRAGTPWALTAPAASTRTGCARGARRPSPPGDARPPRPAG